MATKTPKQKPRRTLGSNIRDARETVGITQLALAHLIGFKGEDAGAYISKIESGKVRQPGIDKLMKIARALSTTLELLLK